MNKEKRLVSMKNVLMMLCVLGVLIIGFLLGKESIQKTPLSEVKFEETNKDLSFEKKEQCASFLKQAEKMVTDYDKEFGFISLNNGKTSTGHASLDRICFSENRNSCYALVTEYEKVSPQGFQSETFITQDLLSGERTNVSYTQFFDDDQSVKTENFTRFVQAKNSLLQSLSCVQ